MGSIKRFRILPVFLLTLVMLCLLPFGTAAVGEGETSGGGEVNITEQIEASGANDLLDQLPDGVEEQLGASGIEGIDPESILQFDIGDFFGSLWRTVKSELTKPLAIFLTLAAIILLCALLNAFHSTMEENAVSKVFSTVAVLCVCGAVILPIADCITRAAGLIRDCSTFILGFIPVFTGIMTVSGKPISGAAYSTVLFGVIQVISQIASTTLVPLLSIFLAFCLVGSVGDMIKLDGVSSTVRTTVLWILGFMLTIFIGILSMQGLVANSADTVTMKTSKFLIGSFVPVVGGAVSEALNSIQGCLGLIRSTVGAFGIIVCLLTFLPIIINIVLLMLSLNFAAMLAGVFGVTRVQGLLKSASTALSLLLGIIIFFAMLLIVATTVMLVLGLGI